MVGVEVAVGRTGSMEPAECFSQSASHATACPQIISHVFEQSWQRHSTCDLADEDERLAVR
jgi:hypothetical protein